jgi:hypothetical protein
MLCSIEEDRTTDNADDTDVKARSASEGEDALG